MTIHLKVDASNVRGGNLVLNDCELKDLAIVLEILSDQQQRGINIIGSTGYGCVSVLMSEIK